MYHLCIADTLTLIEAHSTNGRVTQMAQVGNGNHFACKRFECQCSRAKRIIVTYNNQKTMQQMQQVEQ
jgi:hypothetical protein